MGWSKLTDMSLSDDDILDMAAPIPFDDDDKPAYPCGLRICLTDVELDKLGLDDSCDLGDMIDLRAFATVTSITKRDGCCRVELQIEKLAVEDELADGPERS